MRKIDNLTNKFSLSKTLKFRLIPVGSTLKNIEEKKILDLDKERSKDVSVVKEIYDRYHRDFIERTLADVSLDNSLLDEYFDIFQSKDNDSINKNKDKLRKSIVSVFTNERNKDEYNMMFGKEMINELLPNISSESERSVLEKFKGFTTYFVNFNENRKNIYSEDNKHSTIGYRLIEENLPKFASNIKIFTKYFALLDENDINELNANMAEYNITTELLSNILLFKKVLNQSGIDKYNKLLGGYSLENGEKIKGINELINLYNQKNDKNKIPFLTPLFKQVLSDSDKIDFVGLYQTDKELISSVKNFYIQVLPYIEKLEQLFSSLENYEDGIAISTKCITDYSNAIYGSWDYIINGYFDELLLNSRSKKSIEVQKDEYKKVFEKRKIYLVSELEEYASYNKEKKFVDNSFISYLKENFKCLIKNFKNNYMVFEKYESKESIIKDDVYISLIKSFLDSSKEIEWFIKSLGVLDKDATVNDIFYSELEETYNIFISVDKIYNKVRNYITKKPYSTSKIKLNFDCSTLLNGWDKNKEKDNLSIILRDDKYYYLGIIDKNNKKIFEKLDNHNDGNCYQKMEYKLLPGPNKMLPKVFFAKSNIVKYDPLGEIQKIYKEGGYKKDDKDALYKIIDFYKKSIDVHPDWNKFGFKFKNTNEYNNINQFYDDIATQGYSINFANVSKKYVDTLVNEGKLFLFKIYNKDFSSYSKGKENLHTTYFKMLFDKENLKNVIYKLNGQGEIFYRPSSIIKKPTHEKNIPIQNKNPNNKNKTSKFEYDLFKDKRYSENQFFLHFPITMNFKQDSKCTDFNTNVNTLIKNSEHNYIIGLDRGERNLIYACVIDEKGNIIEQKSFNVISSNGNIVDYHNLLNNKEKERLDARQNWKTIDNIKEIKEGYISQVVHEICKYVIKYDALISLENLNAGFKNSRSKVEKQVYQKFEKMLIDKLNYLVLKENSKTSLGGALNAYQLTYPNVSDKAIQNGIIFYIPAWCTSKIDPVTGFVDLLKPKYRSVDDTKDFISKLDDVVYNKEKDLFEIKFNYDKFGTCASFKKEWIISSYGNRIRTFRNKDKNSNWDNEEIDLTIEYKKLYNKYKINYELNLKEQILNQEEKDFFETFIYLFKLTLQMRNSITGNGDVDYIISPICDVNGKFYDSRNKEPNLPIDADANGAYNIARKLLMIVDRIKEIKESEDIKEVKMGITNAEWLEYAQKNE